MPYRVFEVWARYPDIHSPGFKLAIGFYGIILVTATLDIFWWKLRPVGEYTLESCIKAGFREDPYFNWILTCLFSFAVAFFDDTMNTHLGEQFAAVTPLVHRLVPQAGEYGWTLVPAILCSGVIFGALHLRRKHPYLLRLIMFIEISIGGIVIAVIVITQGIWFSMFMHSLYDVVYFGIEKAAIKLGVRYPESN
jgi:membrane protease YdiL (CAAX protease family)